MYNLPGFSVVVVVGGAWVDEFPMGEKIILFENILKY